MFRMLAELDPAQNLTQGGGLSAAWWKMFFCLENSFVIGLSIKKEVAGVTEATFVL
jgi:hypothetical protein